MELLKHIEKETETLLLSIMEEYQQGVLTSLEAVKAIMNLFQCGIIPATNVFKFLKA